jgi:hypothetical protein
MLQTQAHGAAPRGLTSGDHTTDSRKPKRQTRLNSDGRFSTIPAVALPHADAQGEATIPAYPEAEKHLVEIITAVLTMPVGRLGSPRGAGGICIRPRERNRRGGLVPPGCRDSLDRQRFARDRTQDPGAIGRKERIEDRPSPVIMERGPREPRL